MHSSYPPLSASNIHQNPVVSNALWPANSHNHAQQRAKITWAKSAVIMSTVLLMLALPARAQTFRTIHTFSGYPYDGGNPYAGLTKIGDALYGTTYNYGSFDAGFGVVFALWGHGYSSETVIHTFDGGDGFYPMAPVIRDGLGNLYGTTYTGYDPTYWYGIVFQVDSAGSETVLHAFAGGPSDGCYPTGGLVEYEGDFYGVAGACGAGGYGIVYKVSKNGEETILHNFAGAPNDGAYPSYTSLTVDQDGTFYGITSAGGRWNAGTLYKMTKEGKVTVLHSFAGGKRDGCNPHGAPVLNDQGNLYGTTELCGTVDYGTVWRVTKAGKETILHSFAAGAHDGQYPFVGGVIRDSSGNLYGATQEGGVSNYGVVYKINNTGEFSLLHSFRGKDGMYPYGGLFLDSKGTLYGTTYEGGEARDGTAWSITP